MKSVLLAAVAVGGVLIAAPASAQGVKIGILNDQSGVYADYGGKWSFEATRSKSSPPTTRTSRISPAPLRGAGMRSKAST